MKGVFKLCEKSLSALIAGIATAVASAVATALTNVELTVKTTSVTKNEVCVVADGYDGLAFVVDVYDDEGKLIGAEYYALADFKQDSPLKNVVVDSECCDHDGAVVVDPQLKNAFDISAVARDDSRIAFDSPAYANAHTDTTPTNPWTKVSLAASLNSGSPAADGSNSESNVDYSGTTWAAHPTADAVVATGVNIPVTMDFPLGGGTGVSVTPTTI